MKVIQHETWSKYEWENGDLVRLTKPESGLGSWDRKEAGEFGRVTDARSQHYIQISHHGYTKGSDSIAGFSRAFSSNLVPWVQEPRDEAHLKARAIEVLNALAWLDVIGSTHHPETGTTTVVGHGLNAMTGTRSIPVKDPALPYLLPYLASGEVVERPKEWWLNEAGHALLDSLGVRHETSLAGGGNVYEFAWNRRGVFTIKDKGTGTTQTFEGEKAYRLLVANRTNVRMMHDGKMPDIAREMLDYPRTLRMGNLKVVELDEAEVEVHHPDGNAVFEGQHAKEIRRACGRVNDLLKWFDSKIDVLEAKSESRPSFG